MLHGSRRKATRGRKQLWYCKARDAARLTALGNTWPVAAAHSGALIGSKLNKCGASLLTLTYQVVPKLIGVVSTATAAMTSYKSSSSSICCAVYNFLPLPLPFFTLRAAPPTGALPAVRTAPVPQRKDVNTLLTGRCERPP